jgi:hypothetical protein
VRERIPHALKQLPVHRAVAFNDGENAAHMIWTRIALRLESPT